MLGQRDNVQPVEPSLRYDLNHPYDLYGWKLILIFLLRFSAYRVTHTPKKKQSYKSSFHIHTQNIFIK